MRLKTVEIEGYRSIANKITCHIDPDVTVLLGANDHGKTNILNAIRHLNADHPFNPDVDLNWDRAHTRTTCPCVTFLFELSLEDRQEMLEWLESVKAMPAAAAGAAKSARKIPGVELLAAAKAAVAESTPTAAPADVPPPAVTAASDEQPSKESEKLKLDDIPTSLKAERRGVEGKIQISFPGSKEDATAVFGEFIPRVELIRPQDKVPDSVMSTEMKSEQHEFMRGIFYYAGLDPDEAATLFTQDDTAMMALKKASVQLNEKLKADWSQGKELRYELANDSSASQILLRIIDPAVGTRVVRASQRSSGFTHFFTLKTVLHARQLDHPAHSYIFLFDEPGTYLHPSGQYDLLKVLDAIGKSNQVLYSTHSLFMINKTFPIRLSFPRNFVFQEVGYNLN